MEVALTLSLPMVLLRTVLRNFNLEVKGCPVTYERRDYDGEQLLYDKRKSLQKTITVAKGLKWSKSTL